MLAFVFTLAAILSFILTAAIIAGLAYLGGVLFAPDQPKAREAAEGGQSKNWNPQTLQQEGITRPRAYGKNMHTGNIIQKWTDVVDNREVLYLLIDHGDGPTKGIVTPITDNVFVNDQPIGNFTAVTIQERLGTMNQTVMTGFEKPKLDHVLNTKLLKDEAFVFTTPSDIFDDLEFTILFPNGLRKYKKSGSRRTSTLTLKVRISVKDANSWTDISPSAIGANILEPYFLLYKISDYYAVTRGVQYDLEFTNLTGALERHVNDISLRSVREVIETAFTHPGRAMVGIRAVPTTQLSGNIKIKVIREDRIINVWDGSTWTLEYSNNRAWVCWDIMTLPVITGDGGGTPYAVERYDGVDPQYLDLEFFYAWAEFCSDSVPDGYGGIEARCPFNGIIDETTDTFSLVHKLAAVGRASTYWSGHQLTGWIDDVVTTPIDLVTMDSMLNKTWQNAWSIKKELAGAIEVFYKDERQGYERTSAEWANAAAGDLNNIVTLEGIGIISRGVAIHYINYLLERNRLILNTNKFKVHKDGFRYKLGDILRIQSKPANWGKAFRVVSSTANTITVDRDATAEVNAGDVLHIRSYDTVLEVVVTDTYEVASVVEKVITATINWDVTPVKGNIVAIGASGDIKLRRLIKLTSTMDNYFDVEVETYDAELFDADNLDPDNPDVNYVWPKSTIDINAPLTKSEIEDLISQAIPPQPDIEIPHLTNCVWTSEAPGAIKWAKRDPDEPIEFRYRGTTYEINPGNFTDEFAYWDPDYTTIFRTTSIASVALAPGNWLMATVKNNIIYPANAQQLTHAAILLAGTIRAEHYLELRNNYVFNGVDSLDSSKPFEIPFQIVSELNAIVSIKLSFRIMPYRAYSTAASSGGAATSGSGGGQTSGSGGGQTTSAGGVSYPKTTDSAEANGDDTDFEDGADLYTTYEGNGSHRHGVTGRSHRHGLGYSFNGHTHGVDFPDHTHTVSNHTHTGPVHTHTTPNHTHGVTYGIHEESNSPTVHFHIDNGAGFGGASANYNSDQLDLVITGSISGPGWKGIRFDTNLRCRIAVNVICKLDIDA